MYMLLKDAFNYEKTLNLNKTIKFLNFNETNSITSKCIIKKLIKVEILKYWTIKIINTIPS